MIAGSFQWNLLDRYVGPVLERKSHGKVRHIKTYVTLAGFVIFTAWTVYRVYHPTSAIQLAFTFIAAAIFAGYLLSTTVMNRPIIRGALGMICAFVVAYAAGFDSAQREIKSVRPLSAIKIGEKGKDKEENLNVRILRTGERGVLYFDPTARIFGLLSWDSVKHIDWPISSIWKN